MDRDREKTSHNNLKDRNFKRPKTGIVISKNMDDPIGAELKKRQDIKGQGRDVEFGQLKQISGQNNSKDFIQDIMELWQQRWQKFVKEIGKYGRLIVNDHFAMIILVLLAFSALNYQRLLEYGQLQGYGPMEIWLKLSMAFILTFLMSQGKILWLTQYPDKSFIFPLGQIWRKYWLKGLWPSLVLPLMSLMGGMIISLPFLQVMKVLTQPLDIYLWMIFLLSSLLIHFSNRWLSSVTSHVLPDWALWSIHLLLNLSIMFIAKPYAFFVSIGILLMVILYTLVNWRQSKKNPLRFEHVINMENKREKAFYQWISMFAQVPKKEASVQRMAWLDTIIELLPGENNRYSFEYKRQLWRHENYRNIWIKVTFFIVIMLKVTTLGWMQGIWVLLSVVLTVSQLVVLMKPNRANPFYSLYPVSSSKLGAFNTAILPILLLQLAIYLAVVFNIWTLTSGSVCIILALGIYVPWWYRRNLANI